MIPLDSVHNEGCFNRVVKMGRFTKIDFLWTLCLDNSKNVRKEKLDYFVGQNEEKLGFHLIQNARKQINSKRKAKYVI